MQLWGGGGPPHQWQWQWQQRCRRDSTRPIRLTVALGLKIDQSLSKNSSIEEKSQGKYLKCFSVSQGLLVGSGGKEAVRLLLVVTNSGLTREWEKNCSVFPLLTWVVCSNSRKVIQRESEFFGQGTMFHVQNPDNIRPAVARVTTLSRLSWRHYATQIRAHPRMKHETSILQLTWLSNPDRIVELKFGRWVFFWATFNIGDFADQMWVSLRYVAGVAFHAQTV